MNLRFSALRMISFWSKICRPYWVIQIQYFLYLLTLTYNYPSQMLLHTYSITYSHTPLLNYSITFFLLNHSLTHSLTYLINSLLTYLVTCNTHLLNYFCNQLPINSLIFSITSLLTHFLTYHFITITSILFTQSLTYLHTTCTIIGVPVRRSDGGPVQRHNQAWGEGEGKFLKKKYDLPSITDQKDGWS